MIQRRALLAAAVSPALLALAPAQRQLLLASSSPRALPPGWTLDLDFMTPGTLDPRIVFARTGTGTYTNAAGILQTASANTPRWDYSGGKLNGVLIEEARTNLILQSQFAASWTPTNVTLTPNAVTSPDGTATAATLLESATSGQHVILQSVTKAASVLTYGVSVFARQGVGTRTLTIQVDNGGANGVKCLVDVGSGTVISDVALVGTGWTGTSVVVTSLANGWYRFAFTVTTAATTTIRTLFNLTLAGGFVTNYAGDGTSNIQLYGYQLELGAFPTSYIATTTASVTRAAESATMPTSTWFNASASSLAATYMLGQSPNPSATLVRDACALSDGTANNQLVLRGENAGANSGAFATSIAGAATSSPAMGTVLANGVSRLAAAWNGTSGVGALNGGAAVSYNVGMPPGLTTLAFGNDFSGATAFLNGWLRRAQYWPRALSVDELRGATR